MLLLGIGLGYCIILPFYFYCYRTLCPWQLLIMILYNYTNKYVFRYVNKYVFLAYRTVTVFKHCLCHA